MIISVQVSSVHYSLRQTAHNIINVHEHIHQLHVETLLYLVL